MAEIDDMQHKWTTPLDGVPRYETKGNKGQLCSVGEAVPIPENNGVLWSLDHENIKTLTEPDSVTHRVKRCREVETKWTAF